MSESVRLTISQERNGPKPQNKDGLLDSYKSNPLRPETLAAHGEGRQLKLFSNFSGAKPQTWNMDSCSVGFTQIHSVSLLERLMAQCITEGNFPSLSLSKTKPPHRHA
eukprot:2537993-Amphidinium_carterae.1